MDARLPPPGMDRPTPNLASVPPIPQRPDAASRGAVTGQLEQDRAASLAPVAPRATPAGTLPAVPGEPNIASAAPAPPRLAPAVQVPWVDPRGAPAVPLEPSGQPLAPGAMPDLPPPELLAPAPASR